MVCLLGQILPAHLLARHGIFICPRHLLQVANAVGPLAAIYDVWRTATVDSSADVPTWLLSIGGVALVLGVATCESAPSAAGTTRLIL